MVNEMAALQNKTKYIILSNVSLLCPFINYYKILNLKIPCNFYQLIFPKLIQSNFFPPCSSLKDS